MIKYAAPPMIAAPPATLHITMAAISPSLSPPAAVDVGETVDVTAAEKS